MGDPEDHREHGPGPTVVGVQPPLPSWGLMIAEAKNLLGQDPSVEINQGRERAYGANFAAHRFTNGSQAANAEAILQERLFELSFEGKRWWDLVRFGKAFEKVPSLQNRAGEQHLLLWPISQTTISLNDLMSLQIGDVITSRKVTSSTSGSAGRRSCVMPRAPWSKSS